jgi:hypothetical protein
MTTTESINTSGKGRGKTLRRKESRKRGSKRS